VVDVEYVGRGEQWCPAGQGLHGVEVGAAVDQQAQRIVATVAHRGVDHVAADPVGCLDQSRVEPDQGAEGSETVEQHAVGNCVVSAGAGEMRVGARLQQCRHRARWFELHCPLQRRYVHAARVGVRITAVFVEVSALCEKGFDLRPVVPPGGVE